MVLNVNRDEYVKGDIGTVGISLIVHHQRYMPFPEDGGIIVSPGLSTSVGLHKVSLCLFIMVTQHSIGVISFVAWN